MSVPSEESIYNLIPQVPAHAQKKLRHKSKFNPTVKSQLKEHRYLSKTMGPVKVPVNDPSNFLQKHSKEPQLSSGKVVKPLHTDYFRSTVPRHTERPQMGSKTTRNFVTANAVNNIMSVPRKPFAKYVDKAAGDTQDLEESGLVPKYSKKKDYGKVPGYLEKRCKEMKESQAEYDQYVVESIRKGQMAQVHDTERERLLTGLKANWEEVHHQYQGLSVVTDTAPKKARKERMEAEMKQLEKDIELVERHKLIYISQDRQEVY